MNLTRTLDAESEVLSLADVKSQLRITTTADDDSFRAFIASVRHRTENYLGKTLVTSTWELKLDCFDDEIQLPMDPVQSITSVQYVDTDGVTQTLSSSLYQFDSKGRLKPSYSNSWPSTREQMDAVTVTYIAGKTHAGNVDHFRAHEGEIFGRKAVIGKPLQHLSGFRPCHVEAAHRLCAAFKCSAFRQGHHIEEALMIALGHSR